ncbi:MAG: peptidylprolyl isomerase, partial [Comamonas sp.]|nr:peptidylprolyl isomerase [Comamonas sp.]
PLERVELLKQQMEERTGRELPEEMMSQLKEEIITREIFMQEAQRRGLERSASYAQNMDMARQTILIRELFLDFEKTNPITDAEIEAEYQAFAASNGGKEYRASHILVESEAEAKTLIASIKGGKKFADIAKKSSKDPGSGANGGDLGWASPSSYVPEFTEAMVALEKGKMTEQPVQSQFGWHIIRVDDLREAQLPPLEEVKDQIQQQLEQQKMVQFQEELRAKAKVE